MMQDILQAFAGCQVFSSLDAAQAFHAIPVAEEDRAKTAFVTRIMLNKRARIISAQIKRAQIKRAPLKTRTK